MTSRLRAAFSILAVALLAMAIPVAQAVGKSGNDDGHQNRGKVSSFKNGVLTIKRSSGGTVSGKVTSSTKIRCRNRSSDNSNVSTSRNGADDGPSHDAGDDNGGSRKGGSSGGRSGACCDACQDGRCA